MKKKQKIILVSVFAGIVLIAAIAAGILNYRTTQEGMKEFQIEVISDRDSYLETTDCKSDAEYLGEFLRSFEGCEWQDSEYGIYITGFNGMQQDIENQYWWCISVNGEVSSTGADEVPLQEGDVYTFTLTQGW